MAGLGKNIPERAAMPGGSVAGLFFGVIVCVLMGVSHKPAFAEISGFGVAARHLPCCREVAGAMPTASQSLRGPVILADDKRSSTGAAEMAAAKALTTKVLAIGSWTAKATPEMRPAIMPSEARDTMRLFLAGKIDQWFAKSDGSGAVFLMNTSDPAEAHKLLESLPLGQADMMTFEIIPVGPLWPLGMLLAEPTK